jgi:hypothetical protein
MSISIRWACLGVVSSAARGQDVVWQRVGRTALAPRPGSCSGCQELDYADCTSPNDAGYWARRALPG